MQPITFTAFNCQTDGIAAAFFIHEDPATTRNFVVREIRGPLPHEVVFGRSVAEGSVRFFLHEVIPNGRLALYQLEEIVDIIEVDPDLWTPVASVPSQAIPLIRDEALKRPGFLPMMDEADYSPHMSFFDSLENCALAVQNALDADMWLCSDEPSRRHVITPRTQMDFRAKLMIASMPKRESVERYMQKFDQMLAPQETLVVACIGYTIAFQVTDKARQYPLSARLVAHFDLKGNPVPHGFFRGGWGDLAFQVLGVRLQDYDGPAGGSNGQYPHFGQTITYPGVRPSSVSHCSLLRKSRGEFNRIYGHCVVNGVSYWVRGKLIAGEFAAFRMSAGLSCESVIKSRIGHGYDRLDAAEVPHFWQRLLHAVEAARTVSPDGVVILE